MNTPIFGPIVQHGYVVADAEQAALEWAQRIGAGPFYLFEAVELGNYHYRGSPRNTAVRIALGYWGEVQVELIQPLSDDPVYARALRDDPQGINHYAVYIRDLDGLLEEHALQEDVLHSGEMSNGLKFVYLERFVPGGLHLELIQPVPETLVANDGMIALTRSWDGSRPVRPGSALAEDLGALQR